jgi:hypothetical protein
MRTPIELLSLMYFAAYVPYVVMTRWLATVKFIPLGRPLTGLEVLPAATLLSGLVTIAFVWATGWYRDAHHVQIAGRAWPAPTRWTVLSGIGAALLLFTVPLSFTFKGVSIPFMQLLMRGDVLLIAPLVDLLFGRRVRFFSWIALALVAAGLMLTISARGGLYLPPLAIVTVVLYTVGYFVRLAVMTKTAKRDDAQSTRGYFVEEKLVAIPSAVLALALLSVSGVGSQKGELEFGFIGIWGSGQMLYIGVLAVLLVGLSIFSVLILLDKRENTFCVPLERSASILAGLAAAFILWMTDLGPRPTGAEMGGASLLILAIVLLSLGPRLWPAPVRD